MIIGGAIQVLEASGNEQITFDVGVTSGALLLMLLLTVATLMPLASLALARRRFTVMQLRQQTPLIFL